MSSVALMRIVKLLSDDPCFELSAFGSALKLNAEINALITRARNLTYRQVLNRTNYMWQGVLVSTCDLTTSLCTKVQGRRDPV